MRIQASEGKIVITLTRDEAVEAVNHYVKNVRGFDLEAHKGSQVQYIVSGDEPELT